MDMPRPEPGPFSLHAGAGSRVAVALGRLTRSQPVPVTLRARFDGGRIDLDLVKVEPGHRRRGLATKALGALVAFADCRGLPMRLLALNLPGDDEGPGLDALLAWYEKHGFTDTGDCSVTGLVIMLRQPRTKEACGLARGRLHDRCRHLAGLSGRSPLAGRSFSLPKHR